MCVAIFQKPGAIITQKGMEAGWRSNRDGGGFAYHDATQNKVVIRKGYMELDKFYEAYMEAVEEHGKDSPFLVHMRIRTSGATNANNTHPFPIKGGALIHNGTFFTPSLKYAGPKDDLKSDTRVFAENLYNILTYEDVKAAQDNILKAVGTYNKIVFLYDDGRHLILNENRGMWMDDVWYSNSSCRV